MVIFLPAVLASDGTTPSIGANWGQPIFLDVNLAAVTPPVTPTKVIVTANPTGAIINAPFSLTVNAVDPSNTLASGYSGSATVVKASGPGTLSGTTTASFSGGVLTFTNLLLDTIGTYTLLVSSGSLTPGTTASFTVADAPIVSPATWNPRSSPGGTAIPQTFFISASGAWTISTSSTGITLSASSGTGPGAVTATATPGGSTATTPIDIVVARSGFASQHVTGTFTVAAVTVYAKDTYATAYGTLDTGQTWSVVSGGFSATGGVLTATNSGADNRATVDTTHADAHISEVSSSANGAGLVWRASGSTYFTLDHVGGLNYNSAGVPQRLSFLAPTPGFVEKLEALMVGSTLVIRHSGTVVAIYTDTRNQSASLAGNHIFTSGTLPAPWQADSDIGIVPIRSSIPALFLVEGNSIPAGTGNATPAGHFMVQTMIQFDPGHQYDFVDFAWAGRSITDMLNANLGGNDVPVSAVINGSRPSTIAVEWEIINDLGLLSRSLLYGPNTIGGLDYTGCAEQVYQNMVEVCNQRRAQGLRVLIMTMLPTAFTDPIYHSDTARLYINAKINANWQTFAHAVLDIGNDANMANTSGPNYFDGTHINDTGAAYVASKTAPKLAALVAASSVPSLVASVKSMYFHGWINGSSQEPDNQTFTINNAGGGTMPFTVATATSGGGSWLSASPGSGTNTGTITVSVSRAGMSAGSYAGTITLTSSASGCVGTGMTIPVTFVVNPNVALATANFNGANSGTLKAPEIGGSAWAFFGTSVDWQTLSNQAVLTCTGPQYTYQDAGSGDATLRVQVVAFSSGNGIVFVPFRMSDSNNMFRVVITGNGAARVERVQSGAGVTLVPFLRYVQAGDYIRIECIYDTITVYLNGVAQAQITDTFNQTATLFGMGGQTNTTFDNFGLFPAIKTAPHIALNHINMAFAAETGGGSPADQTLTVANNGLLSTAMVYTSTAAVTTPGGGTWLSVSPGSNTTSGGTAQNDTVSAALGALAAGVYKGTVTVASSTTGVSNTPKVVPVAFAVTASGVTTKLYCSFDGPDNTSGVYDPEIGGAWASVGNDPLRNISNAGSTSPSGNSFILADSTVSDFTYTATLVNINFALTVVFRAVDNANYIEVNGTNIQTVVAGVRSTIGTISSAFANGDVCRIITSSTSITVYKQTGGSGAFNSVGSCTSSQFQTATKIGARIFQSSAIDEILVTSTAAGATHLAFSQQPVATGKGVAFTTMPKVQALLAGGGVDTSYTANVTLGITSGSGGTAGAGATLGGTVTVACVAGVADFTSAGLSLNQGGTAYQLHATSGALTAADSSAFDVASVYADFNGTDSSTLLINPGTGQTWTVQVGGPFKNISNQAKLDTGAEGQVTVSAGSANGYTQVTIVNATGADGGFVFRYQDSGDFWLVRNLSGNTDFYLRSGGGYTLIGQSAGAANGDVLKVVYAGSSITIYRNGTSILSTTDSTFSTQQLVGLRANSATVIWDTFETVPA